MAFFHIKFFYRVLLKGRRALMGFKQQFVVDSCQASTNVLVCFGYNVYSSFLLRVYLPKNDKLLTRMAGPDETARYGKLLTRSKTVIPWPPSPPRAPTGASSERWYRGTFGPPVGPGQSKPTAFLGLCSPGH